MVDWPTVSTVFLDMDGTLLDLHYDNHFWLEHVPRRYAERHGMTLEAAHEALLVRYRAVEGTMARTWSNFSIPCVTPGGAWFW